MGAPGKSKFECVAPLSPQAIIERCRVHGARMGPLRCIVAQVVAETHGPFDFDLVFDAVRKREPRISRGTIYLSLRCFLLAGLIRATPGKPAAAISAAPEYV